MLLVYLLHHRDAFLEYMQTHLFDYQEIFDLTIADIYQFDRLLTDDEEIPDSLKAQAIYYCCDGDGDTISDFQELGKFIGVLRVGTPSCVIPDKTILLTMDEAWRAQKDAPDPELKWELDTAPVPEEIIIQAPKVAARVVSHVTSLEAEKPQQPLPEPVLIKAKLPEPEPQPVVMETYMPEDYPVGQQTDITPYTARPTQQMQFAPQRPANQFASRSQLAPDTNFEETGLARRQYSSLADVRERPMNLARGSINDALRMQHRTNVNPNTANMIFGITPDCGTTTICYVLAQQLAVMFPEKSVCLVDLDIIKPDLTGMITKIAGLDQRTDANILNLAQLPVDDWIDNQAFLTNEITVENAQFAFIAHTTTGFADKRILSAYDYMQKLEMLRDIYDFVIIDGGRVQATADYQLIMLASLHKKILVADGTSRSTLLAFLRDVSSINVDYNVIINKLSRNISPTVVQRQLAREVSASLPIKNSIEPFLLNGNLIGTIEDPVYSRNLLQIIEGVII